MFLRSPICSPQHFRFEWLRGMDENDPAQKFLWHLSCFVLSEVCFCFRMKDFDVAPTGRKPGGTTRSGRVPQRSLASVMKGIPSSINAIAISQTRILCSAVFARLRRMTSQCPRKEESRCSLTKLFIALRVFVGASSNHLATQRLLAALRALRWCVQFTWLSNPRNLISIVTWASANE